MVKWGGNVKVVADAVTKQVGRLRRAKSLRLGGALAMTAVSAAACGGGTAGGSIGKGQQVQPADMIYAFNKGNNTISVIDSASSTVKVVQNVPFSAYGLYPSNQYGLGSGYLLLPEPTKVVILKDKTLKPVATIPMSAAKGIWAAMMPDGKTGVIVGRSNDQISWVNMDPSSREFGVVIKSVTVPNKVGLCDISLGPSGQYAYIPDLYKNMIQVVSTTTGATVYQKAVPGFTHPFMGTVSWNGKIWAVESSSGNGSVSYFSLANPTQPKLVATVNQASGLGLGAHTDEFSPNSRYDFVLDRKSSQVSVIDTQTFKVVHTIDLPKGGKPRVAAFSYHGNEMFVSLEGTNEVGVIDTKTFKLLKVIKVGTKPVGIAATAYAWTSGG